MSVEIVVWSKLKNI